MCKCIQPDTLEPKPKLRKPAKQFKGEGKVESFKAIQLKPVAKAEKKTASVENGGVELKVP